MSENKEFVLIIIKNIIVISGAHSIAGDISLDIRSLGTGVTDNRRFELSNLFALQPDHNLF